jgi:hypothetical protein
MMRLVALLFALALTGLGAGAVGTGEVHPGIATGKAVPCAGPIYVPTAHLGVYSRKVLVAQKTVPTGEQFRFVLPPGRYTISNEGHYVGGPTFSVQADRTTRVVVMNYCM